MKAALVLLLLASVPAHGSGIDSIYPPDVQSEWQYRISRFTDGVLRDEIRPVLTPEERQLLGNVVIDVPPSAPGQEPFAYWRDGDTLYFSAASMHLLGDLMLCYAWLGRHGYVLTTLDDYMLMLAYWRDPAPPPPPRIALGIPDNARDDSGTDSLATLMTHDAFLFLIAHELGHVLHNDPGASMLDRAASQAAEIAADGFALDVTGRIGRVPTGIVTYFELAGAYAPHRPDADPAYAATTRQTHPLTLTRLRRVAADIGTHAQRYARDSTPQTLAEFRLLAEQLQTLADLEGDPRDQVFIAQRGATVRPVDLAPRRRLEIIAIPPGRAAAQGAFTGKVAGTITLGGTPFDSEVVFERRGGQVTGEYGVAGVFGHLEGQLDADTLRFTWSSGRLSGSGVLRRTGDNYEGSTGMAASVEGAAWHLHPAPQHP